MSEFECAKGSKHRHGREKINNSCLGNQGCKEIFVIFPRGCIPAFKFVIGFYVHGKSVLYNSLVVILVH